MTLPQLLLWFSFFGLPVPLSAGAIGTTWLEAIGSDVSTFIASFIVARLTIVVAAYFIVRAVLDAAHGGYPLGSVLTAIFLLAIPATANLIASLDIAKNNPESVGRMTFPRQLVRFTIPYEGRRTTPR